MPITTEEYWLISKTQNVARLKRKRYLIHFPTSPRRPVCGKFAQWRHLSATMWKEDHDKISICEDCLTHSGEH